MRILGPAFGLLAASLCLVVSGLTDPVSLAGAQGEIRLIVQADDMAAGHGINVATIRAYQQGIVRSANVIVAGPWMPEAARLLRENPGLDAGVHLAITSEWDAIKWRPLTHVPTLVDADGYFFPTVQIRQGAPPRTSLKEAAPALAEIEQELRAQIQFAKRAIPHVTYTWEHMGFGSLAPDVRDLVRRLTKEYGLVMPTDFGVQMLGRVYDGKDPGAVKADKLAARLETLGPGTWLMVDHAATDDAEMQAFGHKGYEYVAADRSAVLEAWTSPKVKAAIERRGIRLTNYRELQKSAAAAPAAPPASTPPPVPMAAATPASPSRAAQGVWAQWRGPGGLGISAATNLPTTWTPTTNVKWKTAIPGRGHSSPIVWGDRLFLTTSLKGDQVPGHKAPVHIGFDGKPGYLHPDAVDADYEHALKVIAVDTRTGRIAWERTAYDGTMYDDRHRKNTYASSTMVTDGRLVYAFFESGGLYAYDLDGRPQWQVSLGGLAKAGMGPGTSPVLHGDLIILQCDQEMGTGSFIVALNRRTGKEVWRAARQTRRSWATPLIVRASDRDELIAAGAEETVAYDPATGAVLWRANGTESHPIPSPVAGHGMVFMTAGSQAKRALAIRLGRSGDLTNSDAIVWRYNKGTAYVPSPILVGPHLYLMTDKGLLTCLNALTGEVLYEGGRVPAPATFTASPVAYGDRLLLTSEDGDSFAIKAGPVHEVLATSSVGEPVYASPALGDGTIYIRGEQHLFAIADAARVQ